MCATFTWSEIPLSPRATNDTLWSVTGRVLWEVMVYLPGPLLPPLVMRGSVAGRLGTHRAAGLLGGPLLPCRSTARRHTHSTFCGGLKGEDISSFSVKALRTIVLVIVEAAAAAPTVVVVVLVAEVHQHQISLLEDSRHLTPNHLMSDGMEHNKKRCC